MDTNAWRAVATVAMLIVRCLPMMFRHRGRGTDATHEPTVKK